jgi:DNA-binding GntR family transcriptional regulator
MRDSADTLRRRAYDSLRDSLIRGELPPGSRVSELRTAKDLGISRGPVREAVSQLASEGLIDQVPGLGAFVKVPDAREMADLYDFRDALESFAAAIASTRVSRDQLDRLTSCQVETKAILRHLVDTKSRDLDESSAAQWFAIDARFHGAILSAAQNPWIGRHASDLHFLRRIWCRRLDPQEFDVPGILVHSYHDHARILRALRKGDSDAARSAMSTHIQFTKRNYVAQVERFGATGRVWPRVLMPAADNEPKRSKQTAARR